MVYAVTVDETKVGSLGIARRYEDTLFLVRVEKPEMALDWVKEVKPELAEVLEVKTLEEYMVGMGPSLDGVRFIEVEVGENFD